MSIILLIMYGMMSSTRQPIQNNCVRQEKFSHTNERKASGCENQELSISNNKRVFQKYCRHMFRILSPWHVPNNVFGGELFAPRMR